jgi:hypothetical protein
MSKTVDELRNEIRLAVDRYERVESTGFTTEALAAICAAVGYEIDQGNFPPKSEMRAGIRAAVGLAEEVDPESHGGAFRKADLEAIAAALGED